MKRNDPKKILIVSRAFYPEIIGRATRVYQMASKLQKHYDTRVITSVPTIPFGKFPRSKHLIREECINNLHVKRIWTYQPKSMNPSFFSRFIYYLVFPILVSIYLFFKELHRSHVVIICVPPPPLLLASIVARIFNKKIIIDVGDLWTEVATSLGYVNNNNILLRLLKSFENYCWKRSNMITTTSHVVADAIAKRTGKSKDEVVCIPYEIELQEFMPFDGSKKSEIVYVGTAGKAQAVDIFLKAFAKFVKKYPQFHFHIYGGGDQESSLKSLCHDLCLVNSVHFHDPVDRKEIPSILSDAMIGLVSTANDKSLYYMLPTKTFEYLACGLPILAYGCSIELKKVIEDSKGGIFVWGNDPSKIMSELENLIINDKLRLKYSEGGRRYLENQNRLSFYDLVERISSP